MPLSTESLDSRSIRKMLRELSLDPKVLLDQVCGLR